MTRFIVFTALFFAALVALTIVFLMPDAHSASIAPVNTGRIQEDDPGWDCRTMGNKICGSREYGTPRFKFYDEVFACFAEISYVRPRLSWNARVSHCIPQWSNTGRHSP